MRACAGFMAHTKTSIYIHINKMSTQYLHSAVDVVHGIFILFFRVQKRLACADYFLHMQVYLHEQDIMLQI